MIRFWAGINSYQDTGSQRIMKERAQESNTRFRCGANVPALTAGGAQIARTGCTISGPRSRLPVALPVAACYRPSFRRISSSGSLIRIRCQARCTSESPSGFFFL